MKIFAMDDEVASLYLIKEKIEELKSHETFGPMLKDAEVKTFSDDVEFLDAFIKERPEIVFMDIEMPEINGLDFVKELYKYKKNINVIFVTAYLEYAMKAFEVYASGYILKPIDEEGLCNALSHLRFPIKAKNDTRIFTFGNFEVFYKDKAIKFRSPKSKELLAYLIDRQGAVVSRKEMAGILYGDDYDRNTQRELSRNADYLEEDLEEAGIIGLFINDNGYSVNLSKCDCDLIDYLAGKKGVYYLDEYMEQYSWAEFRKEALRERKMN